METTRFLRSTCVALAIGFVGLAAHAQNHNQYRAQIEQQVREIMLDIQRLEKAGAPASEIAARQAACDALCAELASPESRNMRRANWSQEGAPPQTLFGTPPPDTTATSTQFQRLGFAILDTTTMSQTLAVSVPDSYLWDVDLRVSILHTFNADLDITLTSPSGTTTVISTDNGGSNNNVFGLTTFDDDAAENTTDNIYSNNTVEANLIPEGAMAAFVGEDPNGNWTITIADDDPSDQGVLVGWRLTVTTLTPAPLDSETTTITSTTPLAIPDAPGPAVTQTLNVSGLGTSLCDVDVRTFITHTWNSDLAFKVRSPAGTEVLISTANGGVANHVFNGTLFDDDAPTPVTDAVFVDGVAVTRVTPESAFGAFHGEDPNGDWTLTIQDLVGADIGTLQQWSLILTTCAVPTIEPFCFGDGVEIDCPCHNNSPVGAERGCVNGLGVGAKLTGIGYPSVSQDNVQLMTEDTPHLSYVLYWQSRYTPNMGFGSHFDDGLLCAQAPVLFLGSRFTNGMRETHFPEGQSLSTLGNIPPEGGTRFIQAWYRNAGWKCGTENNLTNGVKVEWVP